MNSKSTNNYTAPQCDIVEVVLEGAILDVSYGKEGEAGPEAQKNNYVNNF